MKILGSMRYASLAILVMFNLQIASVSTTQASTGDANWSPRASERLIKLPSNFLKKVIERDYAKSALATAVKDTKEKMRLKVKTLQDLRGAIDQADGAIRIELRHQYLAEKRAYIQLVSDQQTFRRKHARTKISLYEKLLSKIKRNNREMTPQRSELVKKQTAARNRFQSSLSKVDVKLFRSSFVKESKYAREYAKNVAAIDRLVQAVNAHPMNEQPKLDGTAVSRQDFLRHLINTNEATIAVLDQEQSILGYMAKLVALDATALSETVNNGNNIVVASENKSDSGVTGAVEFFIDR